MDDLQAFRDSSAFTYKKEAKRVRRARSYTARTTAAFNTHDPSSLHCLEDEDAETERLTQHCSWRQRQRIDEQFPYIPFRTKLRFRQTGTACLARPWHLQDRDLSSGPNGISSCRQVVYRCTLSSCKQLCLRHQYKSWSENFGGTGVLTRKS